MRGGRLRAASAIGHRSCLGDGSCLVGAWRLDVSPAGPDGGPCAPPLCERRTTQDRRTSSAASSPATNKPVRPTSSTPTTAGTPLDCISTTAAEAMLGPAPTAPTLAAVL